MRDYIRQSARISQLSQLSWLSRTWAKALNTKLKYNVISFDFMNVTQITHG